MKLNVSTFVEFSVKSDYSKTKTREDIEGKRERKGRFRSKERERERGRKEERDKTLDKALLKKVGR